MASAEVLAALPHRDPFLFIDEIVECSAERIVCRRTVRPDEDVFRGHYPHFPILPGVLLCEAAFQAGALLLSRRLGGWSGGVPAVTRANDIKFSRPVRPGDELEITAEFVEELGGAWFLKACVRKDGKACCRVNFACALIPEGEPR